MKKLLLVCVGLFFFALPVSASMSSDFKDHYRANGLSAYNRDIASLLGQADFHTGKGTTFPGFDIGGTVTAVKTSGNNFSKKNYFYAPFIMAEKELPFLGLGVAARGTSYDGFDSIGGGLKWHQTVAIVHLSASAFYDHYKTDSYDGNHYSVSASASVNVLFATPYVGIGYDYSSLDAKDFHKKTNDDVVRYTAGVNLHPLPLFYVYGAYTYSKYNHGFQGGVGINF